MEVTKSTIIVDWKVLCKTKYGTESQIIFYDNPKTKYDCILTEFIVITNGFPASQLIFLTSEAITVTQVKKLWMSSICRMKYIYAKNMLFKDDKFAGGRAGTV